MAPYQISETLRITTDSRQFVLEERSKERRASAKGEWGWDPVGYFATLTQTLEYALHYIIKISPKELPEAVKEAVEAVTQAAENIHHKLQLLIHV